MVTKHLFKFETEAKYKKAKKNHLVLPNVSSIEESGNVYINGRFTSKEKAEAGTIIAYHEHTTTGEKEIKYIQGIQVNALKKFDSAGVISTKSSGMKGTKIKVLNEVVFDEIKKLDE